MLQQNMYNENNRYFKWIFKNLKETFRFDIISLISVFLAVTFNNLVFLILAFIFYIVSICYYRYLKKFEQNKKPLVITARVKRFITTLVLVNLIILFLTIFVNDYFLVVLALISSFNFYLIGLINIINYPVEKIVFLYYKNKAKTKLREMDNLKIIGITGSYGKTSCKNILRDILSGAYNTLETPRSVNTLNGIMIVINNTLSKFDEVFIAEMGAYAKGDIKALANLVKPKYAIITRIGLAHLYTFGSEENIIEGKMELVESLPRDGIAVLNKDDPKQIGYHIKNKCKVLWIGINTKEEVDVRASNIKSSKQGISFDVKFKGDENIYKFKTKLLGVHNVYNMVSSLALANSFKIDKKKLVESVARIKPVEHRLELKKIGNFYQIDDAFNSNPVGASNALDVLDTMPGIKVVVTPGMIELGEVEYSENKKFGKHIAKVADKVILVGEKVTKAIKEGILEEGFNKDNLYVINDVKESYKMIQNFKENKDIYALYENDLPDTYVEKGDKK
jgi:UDP-N-acetylmuramoyl-tripeptide--D-alanyl-D-alanine ligase